MGLRAEKLDELGDSPDHQGWQGGNDRSAYREPGEGSGRQCRDSLSDSGEGHHEGGGEDEAQGFHGHVLRVRKGLEGKSQRWAVRARFAKRVEEASVHTTFWCSAVAWVCS